MRVLLQRSEQPRWQQLDREWFGSPINPPFEFCFRLTAEELIFSARRATPALPHPEAQEGRFQPFLWKYDSAEFYISTADGSRYMEFNLAPNGAWWAAAFNQPRVVDTSVPIVPPGVIATGHADDKGWECEARVPLADLALLGISPADAPCRVAAAAILNSPEQRFLTTAEDTTTPRPDFHRPDSWQQAELTD